MEFCQGPLSIQDAYCNKADKVCRCITQEVLNTYSMGSFFMHEFLSKLTLAYTKTKLKVDEHANVSKEWSHFLILYYYFILKRILKYNHEPYAFFKLIY